MAMEPDQIESIVEAHLGDRAKRIARSPRGQISETWFFTAGSNDYVIRFARQGMGFTLAKDRYIAESLLSPDIPVARFVVVDRADNRTFAITERVHGELLDELDPASVDAVMPALIDMLDRIHRAPVVHTTGYGGFDANSKGDHARWQDYLLSVADTDPGGFYGDWHHLFDDSFLERDVFERVFSEMKSLLHFCPDDRYLVHGDYGFDNMIVRDGKIVAVLDWANAKLGDFLWDVAWLGLCMPERDIVGLIRAHYASLGRTIDHFDERMRCYYCYIGIDSLRFYAATNQPDGYNWMKSRLERALG